MAEIESLQKTSDPVILEMEEKAAAAELDRAQHPEKNQEYTIQAHFNHKLLLILNKLHKARGDLKSTRDARLLFPCIKSSFADLLQLFKKDKSDDSVIKPVGQWVVENRARLLARDDDLFLRPSHPFLVKMESAALWSTLRPHERVNFWGLIGHPLQLSTIFHHLDQNGLGDIADIVNDILGAGKLAYDRDPQTLNHKQVITSAVREGCTPLKMGKIKKLFERMKNEKDQKTLKSLANLMKDVLPQAAGLRGANIPHTQEDDHQTQDITETKEIIAIEKIKNA